MTVSYAASLRSARMQAVIAAIDANGAASLEIGSSGMATLLVTIALPAPPSFTEANGIITMAGVPLTGVAAAMGHALSAQIKDGAGNVVVSGLIVGEFSGDVILSDADIVQGETVTISSAMITHSP
jgi:hypothetical protein